MIAAGKRKLPGLAWALVIAIAVVISSARPVMAGAVASSQPALRPDNVAALRAVCDAMIASAVKKPYGMGWSIDPPDSKALAVNVPMGALQTPAAGLVLYRAGRVLKDVKYVDAGTQVARAIASCQRPTGKIYDSALYGDFAGGKDAEGSRDAVSTRAGLGLILEILDTSDKKDTRLQAVATQAAVWIRNQEDPRGGWPSDLAIAGSRYPLRVYKMAQPDWRDNTLALALAGDVLGRSDAGSGAIRSADLLAGMQLHDDAAPFARGAWTSMYGIDALPVIKVAGSTYSIDTVATLHAGQVLVWRQLSHPDDLTGVALRRLAQTMKQLRRPDGQWYRLYGLPASPMLPATRADEPMARLFETTTTQPEDPTGFAPPGMQQLIDTIDWLQSPQAAMSPVVIHEEIASLCCGLTDLPLIDPPPADAKGLDAYMARHPELNFDKPKVSASDSEASYRMQLLQNQIRQCQSLLIRMSVPVPRTMSTPTTMPTPATMPAP
jgi:hypothetical protein